MAVEKFQVKATLKEGFLVETEARGHRVIVDEPKNLGGTDQNMNPVELLLSALGACQSIVIQTYAKQFGIQLDHLTIDLEGELDTDGFLNKSDVRPGYSNIRSTYHITTDESEEKLDEFIQFVEAHCPVGDTILNPVNLTSRLVVNNLVK
ncbi:OsmC family protein [Bacillus andreraoultii]|uniref:OsmC family protein n=1 Tax=Bacillus andreraoultii TaxID=1499685 RepID=UPI00053B31BD|nr:OsmC family protein [Bacillus andreraoultii]